MIKRTLYFGNPSYLSIKLDQLQVSKTDEEGKPVVMGLIPVEDIGVVVLDHPQITCTFSVFDRLLENNAAIITCDSKHLPVGLLLPLSGNSVQSERFRFQIEASQPLKKQLWQQTIERKIRNQAAILKKHKEMDINNMLHWAESVSSGDKQNHEARAAAFYWKNMFPEQDNFLREREGDYPNNFLNYGYAILRAVVARALVSSGLLPTLGIHHHNRYNAYCLADDIMEPYRPYVDELVLELMETFPEQEEIDKNIKAKLLQIPVIDVVINGQKSPLMVGISQTTASLQKCFEGSLRRISYPEI
jgi:CRISPR-associated protein Cas1